MAKGRKTGGRKPGSLNKATLGAKEILARVYTEQVQEKDWRKWRSHKDVSDLRRGIGSYRSTPGGFQLHAFCILILEPASSPLIQGESRMRKSARTDLCGGGRSAMIVPAASICSVCM